MGNMQEGDNGPHIQQGLDRLNEALEQRASEAGVPIGIIKIDGAGDDPEEQVEAIMKQYDGLVERLAIPTPELPDSTE